MPNNNTSFTLEVYSDSNGKQPLTEWLDGLKDYTTRARIFRRLERLQQGNRGDCKSVGDGVNELRLFFGKGYRVYYTERGGALIVLLCGGDKDTQQQDIARAKMYRDDYMRRIKP
jgi:putative addiction module killer protein